MTTNVVETAQLSRRYGSTLSVDGVNLRVPQGSIYGFLGPNGAGKTTTIRMLLGLIRPTSGSVRIFDLQFPQHRMSVLKRVGSLVESPSYYGHLTGYENLAILATLLKISYKRIDEMLQLVRLTPAAHRKVSGYSLGMKQRLGIAGALLAKPDLLILDEPTNGLDPAGIQEIRSLIRELPRDHGVTVMVSSHLLAEVEQVATHVGIIHQGQLKFQGDLAQLRSQSSPKLTFLVNQTDHAMASLANAGFTPSLDGEKIVLPFQGQEDAATANKILVNSGCSVYRMMDEQPSLEDLFLRLVGTGGSL